MAETADSGPNALGAGAPGAAVAAGAAAGAAPEAAAAADGPDPSEQMLQALREEPYNAETLQKIKTYYTFKAIYPRSYVYTNTGDLEIMFSEDKKRGKKVTPLSPGIIQLKRYVPLEAEERAALETWRAEELAMAEQEYEMGMTTLREAMAAYKAAEAAGEDVSELKAAAFKANIDMRELDIRRNAVRSAVREIDTIGNPPAREILLDQPNETRKMFKQNDPFTGDLHLMSYYDFDARHFYGKYVPDEAAPAAAAAAAEDAAEIRAEEAGYRKKLKDGRIARIFFDPTKSPVNNFLSPLWAVKLVIRETQYNFPLQAYEAERARELKKEELRGAIMRASTAMSIRITTRKETAHPADARGLWLEIYTAVYQQNPALKEQLLGTGTDALVYADPRAGPSGVGLEEESPSVLDPTKWTGENVVGTVLETLRTRMREETMAEAPTGPANEHAITEEEAEARRVGAIINAARRRNA
jgi:predicted NAD-dependent protein-ADP-ribosyltransferase YbiA (DUF1768 family)